MHERRVGFNIDASFICIYKVTFITLTGAIKYCLYDITFGTVETLIHNKGTVYFIITPIYLYITDPIILINNYTSSRLKKNSGINGSCNAHKRWIFKNLSVLIIVL